ncbi:unnamed protein product [Ambrosiozyma monospora]|uniref:Unnamed protein product n=1 Tax=Ambrosiozyma monospora TaxID=43982 RepID=A0ACB5T6X7_AMBMO|nr:unnamed protein product [Ambrosiozyma monospora]
MLHEQNHWQILFEHDEVNDIIMACTLRNFNPQNDKIKVCHIDGDSCMESSFKGLKSLERLSIGTLDRKISKRTNSKVVTDSKTLDTLPMEVRYLDLFGANIIKMSGNTNYSFPKSLFSLTCDPDSLASLDLSTLDNVRFVHLKTSDFLDENNSCWENLPAPACNKLYLTITGNIPKHKIDAHQILGTEYKPLKIGGMTAHKRIESIRLEVISNVIDDETHERIPTALRYYCIDYDESNGYEWENEYGDTRFLPLYFNIVVPSEHTIISIKGTGNVIRNNCKIPKVDNPYYSCEKREEGRYSITQFDYLL